MNKYYLFLVLTFSLVSCSISTDDFEENKKVETVSVASWNVQTFFDSEIEGTEYSDYQNLAKWSKDKYLTRLGRLCEVITTLNADIFVLEEIENTAVVQDIANQLAGNVWDRSKNWNYACFTKETGTAIGCAVFSRYELKDLRVHTMNIQTQVELQPSVRPLIQLSVDVSGKELIIVANHWKSKSGGEIGTEIWRDWQESMVANILKKLVVANENFACIMCGDFNRDAEEFLGNYPQVIFRGTDGNVETFSPWFSSSGDISIETGSYFYNGEWERIDHIFSAGQLKISAFGPKNDGVWCTAGGIPNPYKLYSGEGYSDHLPVMCVVNLF